MEKKDNFTKDEMDAIESCKWCNGSGYDSYSESDCPDCEGSGLKGGNKALSVFDEYIEHLARKNEEECEKCK